jgi:peroxiredoxin
LDNDDDGRFFGAAEYRKAEEVMDVCGLPLQVAELDPAGLSIVFRTSALTVPQVNSPIPPFSVVTTSGALIRSSDFRQKLHILDFWASWCGPCVAKLVAMESIARDYSQEASVIGINVDEPERRAAAEQLIREKALSFPQVIRAQGEKDFLWKMFGSMSDVRLSIPLYVVVDGDGLIRYAANGGDDLRELKKAVEAALGKKHE